MVEKLLTFLYGQAVIGGRQEGSYADAANQPLCSGFAESRKPDGNVQQSWLLLDRNELSRPLGVLSGSCGGGEHDIMERQDQSLLTAQYLGRE